MTPKYKRILLKLSGEALMGDDPFGINRQTIESIVNEVAQVARLGVELGVVNASLHTVNECVRVSELAALHRIYFNVLRNLLAK